jgi:hypothetical protein
MEQLQAKAPSMVPSASMATLPHWQLAVWVVVMGSAWSSTRSPLYPAGAFARSNKIVVIPGHCGTVLGEAAPTTGHAPPDWAANN